MSSRCRFSTHWGFDGFGIRELDYADGKFFEFRQFRRSEATLAPATTSYLLFLQFAYQ